MNNRDSLTLNINAAKGLHEILKTNLGPKGSVKMLVSASGEIKLTKDGDVLLKEMQIQNPTALMIARTAVAQDNITGDGTTSIVLYIGELLKQAEWYISEGTHARIITEGWEVARKATLEFLETCKIPINVEDRKLIRDLAHTSMCTKISGDLNNQLAEMVVEAVLSICGDGSESIDLSMVEIIHMKHNLATESRLIKGLVLDHGTRHIDMPRSAKNCFILNCNISLEYEKSQVNSCYLFSSAKQKDKIVSMERESVDAKVNAIIDLKRAVCTTPEKSFMIINQKGIDPTSLNMLAKENIIGLRRAKRRNAERLQQACGGYLVNSTEELSPGCLGFAGSVVEHTLGDEKYTFLEDVKNPKSVTILLTAYGEHDITQMKDAIRDGLSSVKNVIDDRCVILGGGTFEIAASLHLMNKIRRLVSGKLKLGVDSFAQALLGIPKILAENAGFDPQETTLSLLQQHENGLVKGLDIKTGDPVDLRQFGVYDNYNVKRQILLSAPIISSQILLVDEIIRFRADDRENVGEETNIG